MASSIDIPTYPTSNTDEDDATHPLADEEFSSDLFSSVISKGVIHGIGNTFQVYADATGMHVKVRTGRATSGGFWGNSDDEEVIDISAAHPSSPRIDSIVLRLDRTSPATLKLRVVDGAANLTPVVPTLDSDDVYLADVRVDGGVSSIASNKVTDKRVFAQPGPSSGQNQTQFRGDQAAPAFLSTSGTVMGLIGLRTDVATHSDDIVVYTYGGDIELHPEGTLSVVFPAASNDVGISVRRGDIDMITGLLRFDPSATTATASDGGGSPLPANPNKYLKVLIGGIEHKIPLYLA